MLKMRERLVNIRRRRLLQDNSSTAGFKVTWFALSSFAMIGCFYEYVQPITKNIFVFSLLIQDIS